MGTETGCIEKASLGKPVALAGVREVDVRDGYRLWSRSYDRDVNPILAVERRVIRGRLDRMSASYFLDIATGTGYWLDYALSRGARANGIDLSHEMLRQAAGKPGMRSHLLCADMNRLPLRDSIADIAICSLAAGYVPNVENLFRELARVARHVIVSDLHERAIEAGWNRCFEAEGCRYQIRQYRHSTRDLDAAAGLAGLRIAWRESSYISEAERQFFVETNRQYAFAAASSVPAILATCWSRA